MSPLRVLLTVDAVGGVWTYALDLARGLAHQGITVTVAVLGPTPSAAQVVEAAGLDVRSTGLTLDWLAGNSDAVERAAIGVAELARDCAADIVHLNSPALSGLARFEAPVVAGCHSCVRTWWDAVEAGPLPILLAWQADLIAKGYAAARQLMAPSKAFGDATRRAYLLPRSPVVVHNGRRPLDLPAARPGEFIFTAGRLWDRGKNVAALDLLAAGLPWPIIAAGPLDGPNGSTMTLRHIRAAGRLDMSGLAKYLAQSPIFIPLARYEPFGIAVLEAAQAGCALVLADTAGFRELWDGAALFVPLDDEVAARSALQSLMADPEARRQADQAAVARSARYTVSVMAQGMAQIYRDVACRQEAA